jgi:hypothetical protein
MITEGTRSKSFGPLSAGKGAGGCPSFLRGSSFVTLWMQSQGELGCESCFCSVENV